MKNYRTFKGNDAHDHMKKLTRIGSTAGGWEVYFEDKEEGTFWFLTYPHSEYHGGGPALLEEIDQASIPDDLGE